jgi:CheY-like chemotaxis protein
MKIRALWIDDGAMADLVELTGPVIASGRYTLSIALSISDAIAEMQRREFHVVIVDIRLPPGELKDWNRLYQKGGENRATAKLGLDFLKACLGKHPHVKLSPDLEWANREELFGVFTAEREVMEAQVRALGINVYHVKEVDPPRRKLLELIDEVRGHAP